MKEQMEANMGVAVGTKAPSPAQQDEAMKNQIKIELNKNRPSMNSSASQSQVEEDGDTKSQIKVQLGETISTPGAAIATSGVLETNVEQDKDMKNEIKKQLGSQSDLPLSSSGTAGATPAPVDSASHSRTFHRRGRRNRQSDRDAAMKSQIRTSREARVSGPQSLELNREPSSGMVVGDSVDPQQVSSVRVDARESSVRTSASSTGLQEANPSEKGRTAVSAVSGERPGAFPVQTRAYGGLPAWVRRQNHSNQVRNPASDVSLPPEMRGIVQEEQSNLPPEMRVLSAEHEDLDRADDIMLTAEVNAVVIDKKGSAGPDGGSRRMWLYLIGSLVLIAAIVGVVIGGTSGDDKSSGEDLSSSGTASPTAAPSAFLGYQCPEYEDLPLYVDPNLDHIEDQDVSDFYSTAVAAHGTRFGYSAPVSPDDYCSPTHLAFVSVSHELAPESDDPQKLENHLALAVLYFSWSANGNISQWFSTLDECTWNGVTCDENKNLIEINVRVVTDASQELVIPSEIGLLTDLSRFWSRDEHVVILHMLSSRTFLTIALSLHCFRRRIVEACR